MGYEITRIDIDGVNCYLVKVSDGFILFDTAGPTLLDRRLDNRREVLEEELVKYGCIAGNLKLVVLTHGHNDHVGNAAYIKKKYKTKVAIHKDDTLLVEKPTIEKVMSSLHFKPFFLKLLSKILAKQIRNNIRKTLDDFELIRPDVYMCEGDNLSEYGLDARVLHLPGHTEGSIGILTSEGDLIAGDTLTNMKRPDASANAYDFYKLSESIDRLRGMNIKKVYPGHGASFDGAKIAKIK